MVVAGAGEGAALDEARHAYMRYVGQGHEIVVPLPVRELAAGDGETLAAAFDAEYARLYARTIPGQEREVLSWTLTVTARKPASPSSSSPSSLAPPASSGGTGRAVGGDPESAPPPSTRRLFDPRARRLRGPQRSTVANHLAPDDGLAGAGRDRRGSDHHRGPGGLPGHRQPVRLPGARPEVDGKR